MLKSPEAIKNPFFLLAPDWALIPLLIIAALATVIASQAVISGVFSLTRQAVRLGYLSPMRIIHTSEMESGQIYIPFVNWMLYVAVVIVIVSFEHSSNLAAAYGIAVTGTMVLTSILSTTVARQNWHWNKYFVALILIAFLCVDIPLFTANLDKLLSGGWLPLSLGTVMFIVMTTWKSERFRLLRRMHEHGNSLEAMIASLEKSPPVRVPGTAVYMSRAINVIPFALMHNLKHNKVLHERVILLTLRTEDAPYVHNVRRVQIEQLSPTFWRVVASYGWRETPNVEEVFHRCGLEGLSCRMMETSFFMSHESLIIGKRPWYLRLRGKLHAGKNAGNSLFARHGGLTVQILRALAEAAVDDLGAMIRELDAHVDDDELIAKVLGKARRAGKTSCEVDGLRERDRLRRGAYALFDNAVVRGEHVDARFGKFVFDLSGDTGQLNGKFLQKSEASGGLGEL